MGSWERIDPKCQWQGCIFREGGYCTILNDTNFEGRDCTFYKAKPKKETPQWTEGQHKKIREEIWKK